MFDRPPAHALTKLDQFIVKSEEFLPNAPSQRAREDSHRHHRQIDLEEGQQPRDDPQAKSIIYEPQQFPFTKNASFGAFPHHSTIQPATFTTIVGGSPMQSHPHTTFTSPTAIRYAGSPVLQQSTQRIVINGHAPILRPVTIQQEQHRTKSESEYIDGLQTENDLLMKEYEHLYALYQKQLKAREQWQGTHRQQVIEESSEEESHIAYRRESVQSKIQSQLQSNFDEFQFQFKSCVDGVISSRIERGANENHSIAASGQVIKTETQRNY